MNLVVKEAKMHAKANLQSTKIKQTYLFIRSMKQRTSEIIIVALMATYLTLSILFMNLILSAKASEMQSNKQDLLVAIEEMHTATYFTFVTLINMCPLDRIPGNITFLMPKDRMLSRITLSEKGVSDFLLRHSIPSPLLFEDLERLPTGSIIPTSESNFTIRVSNNGRRSFHLNNIQIISPNICTAGSTIRCHGINGILIPTAPDNNKTIPSPTYSQASSGPAAPPTAPSWPKLPPPPVVPMNQTPTVAPPPVNLEVDSQKSGSSQASLKGVLFSYCMMLLLDIFHLY